jgi:hypothetical protein
VGYEGPGNGALDAGFEVLCEPPASAEPGEGSFDHPSAPYRLACPVDSAADLAIGLLSTPTRLLGRLGAPAARAGSGGWRSAARARVRAKREVNAVHENDFIMATKIDRIFAR